MNEALMRKMGFGAEVDAKKHGLCPLCRKQITKAELCEMTAPYFKEFQISGLCAGCQDKAFEEEEENDQC